MRKKTFGKFKKEKAEALDIDITSLLDILVILLVFLLKSYNSSDLTLEVAENISLPDSKSETLGNMAIIVQVGKGRDLWIGNKKIGNISTSSDEKIELLFDALKKEATILDEKIKDLEGRSPAGVDKEALLKRKVNRKRINIVLDQSLPYAVLRRIMHTSALAGFPEFKFIVQGNF
jgi:biopolymer transport protein ExbD